MEFLFVFIVGGAGYGLLELMWRGWTHWTMLICGGTCFTLMYLIADMGISMPKKCILSAAAITTVEYFTGCIVNLRFHWQVWDYSSAHFNILGQICPAFMLAWLALSVPGIKLCMKLHRIL